MEDVMRQILLVGGRALARTPEQLAILKQAGVVDAGGQGLIYIYEGFLNVILGDNAGYSPPQNLVVQLKSAQSYLSTESIEFGYCTEFLVKLASTSTNKGIPFHEAAFRNDLAAFGDSLLVVADDDLVKVHIHAEYPGQVMDYAMKYGELTRIKIENMREQHSHIVMSDLAENQAAAPVNLKEYGFVAIGAGDGISAIFNSLGVDVVLLGGQTMNPCIEDIIQAIQKIAARTIYVLPNNSNIILAAQQAKEMLPEHNIIIIPSKTIPQGMAAMVSFNPALEYGYNTENMLSALTNVQSGQVTFAVRDTEIDDIVIKKADFLGMLDNQIIISNIDLLKASQDLLKRMLDNGGEIVTILSGLDAPVEITEELELYIQLNYPEAEVEIHSGGQPIYPYIFSVE